MGMMRGPAWEEDAATFYLDNGDGNPATVIYDYKNVSGEPCNSGGLDREGVDGAELVCVCLQTAAGELQIPAPPRLLHHPRGQGQHPGAGCHRRELSAPAGGHRLGQNGAWGAHSALCTPLNEELRCSIMLLPHFPFSPLPRLRRNSLCPWLIAPSWVPLPASSAASSPSTGLSLAGGVQRVPLHMGGETGGQQGPPPTQQHPQSAKFASQHPQKPQRCRVPSSSITDISTAAPASSPQPTPILGPRG